MWAPNGTAYHLAALHDPIESTGGNPGELNSYEGLLFNCIGRPPQSYLLQMNKDDFGLNRKVII